jgi:hypothetical protein
MLLPRRSLLTQLVWQRPYELDECRYGTALRRQPVDGPNHPLADRSQAVVARIGLSCHVRGHGDAFSVDRVRGNGTVVWPDYANGPDLLLAIVGAEQRYLAEEFGGATYLDKARERLRRWEESPRPAERPP